MGNCLFGGGLGPIELAAAGIHGGGVIKVVTTNGGIMEFCSPITVEFITDEFPGHGIFRSHDLFWKPLSHQQLLEAGESYYLLPLGGSGGAGGTNMIRNGHVRSNSTSQIDEGCSQIQPHQCNSAAPYRMSFESRGILKRSQTAAHQNLNFYGRSNKNGNGFWKVKLVISPQQLLDILSQEARTEELIESVRTVAKCRKGADSPLLFSGQCSLSGSSSNSNSRRNHAYSADKDALSIDFF